MKRVYSLAERVLVWLPSQEDLGFMSKMEVTMRFLREMAGLDSQSSNARRELGKIIRRMRIGTRSLSI
jgi:hypothetical protein